MRVVVIVFVAQGIQSQGADKQDQIDERQYQKANGNPLESTRSRQIFGGAGERRPSHEDRERHHQNRQRKDKECQDGSRKH